MPKLTIHNGDTLYREIELDDRDLRFGRGEQNDVVLIDATKSVSRLHAELRRENDAYVLFDSNSQNGIWVGGRRQQRIVLEPGVPVTVGLYTFQLSDLPATDPGPPTAFSNTSETFAGTGVRRSAPAPLPPPGPAPGPRASGRRVSKAMLFGACAVLLLVIVMISRFMVRPGKPDETPSQLPITEEKPSPLPPSPADPSRDQHVAAARDALARADYDTALQEIDAVLAAVPDDRESVEIRATIVEKKAADAAAAGVPPGGGAPGAPPAPGSQAGATGPTAAPGQGGLRGRGAPPGPPPPPGPRATITCRPSETQADCYAREQRLLDRYTVAKATLDAGALQTAFAQLSGIARDEPGFRERDIEILLTRARTGLREMTQQTMAEAARAEGSNDLEAASQQYERAAQIERATQVDRTMADVAEAHVKRLRARMKEIGSADFTRARQFDAVGRVRDALQLYDRAYKYLPDEDPNKKTAKERLDVLRGLQ